MENERKDIRNISQEICKATNLNELHKQRNTYGTI
jgi:hypothetical protein